ncbi:DUF5979 domain-containing protein, partial [Nakamurella sp.]|uniref:DUF5979 domain-containing protein n=1 Tax=Nakamurella sp. TaxID=1869182 RepID=UPI003B3A7D52
MITATVAPVPPAVAATVSIGTVSAQMADQQGVNNGTGGNCIRYAPSSGTGSSATSSAWVTNTAAGLPNSAVTAHGYSGRSCPDQLSTITQSALGFRPSTVTSAPDGAPFLIGGMTHYNNPITANDQYFKGRLKTTLGGFTGSNTLTFNWTMYETPNTGAGNCCNDITTFDNQISDVTLSQGGLTYQLVILGFVPNSTATSCPAAPGGTPVNEFSTVEGAQTSACLYAELQQVRSLRIVKNVVGSPPGTPTFRYTSTSTLTGSAWANSSFAVSSGGSVERALLSGDTVTVTEADSADDRWSLTGLTCQQYDAQGQLVTMDGTTNLAQRRVSLDPVPAPLYASDPVIICTYTNSYTPRTTLTLLKQVQGNVVSPTLWTLTATGAAAPTTGTTISGPSGSAAVTGQRIVAGSYRLAETGTADAATGFVQVGTWTCTAGGTTYPVADGVVTLPDLPAGSAVTCTAVNRQATGSLQIGKIVTDPNGGYTGGSGKTFSGTYNCGTGATGTFSTLTTAAPVTISGIPAGRSCTVTESAPAGGLLNASFAWGAPTFTTQPVTIPDQGTATVTITNPVVQKFGTFAVTKTITGPGGYTGGVDRIFPVAYTCTLVNGPTSSGTLNLTTAQAVSPASPIPTGSVCTFTETLTAQDGDFGDPSYAWSGDTVDPTAVTIGDNTTAGLTITNTYVRATGELILTKRVVGGGYTGTAEDFTVGYNCGVVSGSVTLAKDGSRSVTVPAGNTCSVAEVPPSQSLLDPAYVWDAPTWSDGATATNQATIPADGSATLTVTNSTIPVFGKVSVTKAITGETDGVTTAASFAITVTCSNGYSDTVTVGVNGTGVTPDLPVGTQCSFAEATPSGGLVDSSYAWGTPVLPGPVTVVRGQTVGATVTNPVTRVLGDLEITKELDDPSDRVDGSRTYTIGYSCTHTGVAGANGSVDLAAGESTVIPDIPLESRCTVIEDPATLDDPPVPADPSWVWLPPTYRPGSSVLITSATDPATVVVVNRTSQLTGTFQLIKTVVGAGKQLGYLPGSEFTFDVNCGEAFSGPVQLADGQGWQPTATIPVGTECTITETGKPAPASTAYGWDDVVFTIDRAASGNPTSATFTVGSTPIQVTATNPITPRFGSIELSKQVTGDTAGLVDGATFRISVNCGPGELFVATLADGEADTIDSIPVGSTCAITETPPDPSETLVDASYAWGAANYLPDGPTVTIAEPGQQVAVTVQNPIVRVTAPVGLVKSVTGGQGVVDPSRTYPVTWSCTYRGTEVAGGTVNVPAGPNGLDLADDVPVTSVCTATEGTLTAPSDDPAYRWVTPAVVTPTTVTQAGPNTITVANTLARDTGQVVVNKEVTGAVEGYIGTEADFTLHGQCSVPGTGIPTRYADGDIANGGSVTIAPVSVGWTCSGFEDTPSQSLLKDTSYAWGSPVITGRPELTPEVGGTFVLPEVGATQQFDVKNPVVRVSSTFRITKTVLDPFGALAAGTEFSGTYSCAYGTDAPVTGEWTLTNGGTFTGPPVYLNSVCTVTENDLGTTGLPDGSFAWTAPVIGDPVTVVPGGTATVSVTNTIQRLYGGLTVTKTVAGASAGIRPGTTYTGVWTCSLGGQTWTDRWTVDPSSSLSTSVFTPADARVPATATCSIIEDTPSPASLVDQSFAWSDRTYDPASVTLAAGQTATLGVTNTVVRVYSGFDVRKSITGPVADNGLVPADRVFSGTWSCRYGDDAPVTGPWTASVATSWVQAGILVGSVCAVTSEVPPGAGGQPVAGDPSFVWLTPGLGDAVTVTPPTEANQQITVANPTDRIFGSFFITKSVSGATGGITDPRPFPMTYSCAPGSGPAITGSISLTAGQTVTVGAGRDIDVDIPIGSVCTLTEPLDTMPPLQDGAWSWGTPAYAVVGPIPTAGPVTEPCVPGAIVTPCLGVPARSVTVTIPPPQEDEQEPTVGLTIDNPVVREFGSWTVTKSSTPASGSTVAPGDPITYTLTVSSTGAVPVHDVIVTDDLSQVLPFATIGPITAPDGTAAMVDGTTLTWTVGTLPAQGEDGDTLTLSYQATVNPGAGGVTLRNLVTGAGDVPPTTCAEPDPDDPACSTVHTTPDALTIVKEPNGPPAFDTASGNWTVPYRITVTNPNAAATVFYTLTDAIAFPADVTVESGTVTAAPAGVTLFDPAWNGSDRTTIAADVALPGGAAHTFDVAVVARVPLTLGGSHLSCAASGSGGGSGFLNTATITFQGTESSDDACTPIPVGLVAVKQWTIDGVAYANGNQPSGFAASLTLDAVERTWGTVYLGYQPGAAVVVGENLTLPGGCTGSSTGTGAVSLDQPLTAVRVVNVVTCSTTPTPTQTPNQPAPGPGPYPPTPLPNTGFAAAPWLIWGGALLVIGGLFVLLGGRRRGRPGPTAA